jgi:hypothetical protein
MMWTHRGTRPPGPWRVAGTVGVLLAVVAMTATSAGAHAGNTSSAAIHACANDVTGITRIVGVNGKCLTSPPALAEHAVHWAIAGPPGPAGPLGVIASFDALAGLACTRHGSLGTLALIYGGNGDATLRCVLPGESPPSPEFTGTYSIEPAIDYECRVSGLRVTAPLIINSFHFVVDGTQLTATPLPVGPAMRGSVTGTAFIAESVDGVSTYVLTGVFQPGGGTWTGELLTVYRGLFACQPELLFPALTGTRQ